MRLPSSVLVWMAAALPWCALAALQSLPDIDAVLSTREARPTAEGFRFLHVTSKDADATAPREGLIKETVAKGAPDIINVHSDAITPNGAIPEKYSDYAAGVSPPLFWSGIPNNAKSVVLVVEDPKAPGATPFLHWAVANLPPQTTHLPAGFSGKGAAAEGGPKALQGLNSKKEVGYLGPRPPPADPPHPYHFQVFALDTVLDLPKAFNREALLNAMQGHVVAQGELMGTFGKQMRRNDQSRSKQTGIAGRKS